MNAHICPGKNEVFGISAKMVGTELSIEIKSAESKSYIMGFGDQVPHDEDRLFYDASEFETFTDNFGIRAKVIDSFTIDIATLKNLPDFGDHSSFMLYSKASGHSELYKPRLMAQLFNLYAQTSASKSSAVVYHNANGLPMPLGHILVPFADSDVSEYSIGLNVHDMELVTTSGLTVVNSIGLDIVRAEVLPEVKFADSQVTCSAGGSVQFSFALRTPDGAPIIDHDAQVYLDATGGALTLSRVKTNGGSGTSTFLANGLTAGDSVKVKAGFKFFSGTDDLVINIT